MWTKLFTRATLLATLLTCAACSGGEGGFTAPYPRPVTSGEAAGDDALATAPPLPAAETGFIDVPRQHGDGDPAPARMFYAFRAADASPEAKPLLVVFNGGPGGATSSGLLVSGTGPSRVRVPESGAATVEPNPASFTRFANVLWVDERHSGFSYAPTAVSAPCTFDPVADAVDFVHVLLGFVEAHPRLATARVGFVGESYGGLRAATMLHEMLHAAEEPEAGGLGLRASMTRWIGDEPTFERVAERVLGLALIQPFVLGKAQLDAQDAEARRMRAAHPEANPYDIRITSAPDPAGAEPPPSPVLLAMADPEKGRALFGVELGATPRLGPADRVGAARVTSSGLAFGRKHLDEALSARLGPLGPGDRYYLEQVSRCATTGYEARVDPWPFVVALRTVPVFVTDAAYDTVIRSSAIFDVLASRGYGVDASSRPGHRVVSMPGEGGFPPATVAVRFAPYEAGHMVPMTAAEALSADLRAWMAQD